jgi:hypothetical protein
MFSTKFDRRARQQAGFGIHPFKRNQSIWSMKEWEHIKSRVDYLIKYASFDYSVVFNVSA